MSDDRAGDDRVAVRARADLARRSFVLDERIRYGYSAPVTDLRQYLRIVPRAVHGHQRRQAWHLRVEGVASWTVQTFSDRWGNLTIAVSVPRVDETVEFVLHAEAEIGVEAGPPLPAGAVKAPTRLTAADARLTALAEGLRADGVLADGVLADGVLADGVLADGVLADGVPAGLTADGVGAGLGKRLPDVAEICARVHASIGYEWGVTGVHTSAAEALAGGRGVCQDYAHIMLAVCRLAGIPARYVSGHLTGEGGSHAWVEILQPRPDRPGEWCAQGWDPTHNRRTNADYLVVAVGRDYADAAPLWGTFEGDDVTSTLDVEKRLCS